MQFRNLNLFRFGPSAARALTMADLQAHALRACGPLELQTRGFVSPYGRDSNVFTHVDADFRLFLTGTEERLLPSVVVAEELAQRVAKIAATEGRRPGAKERKRLREEVISELLPRSFVKPGRMGAYVDVENGWLVVDSASRTKAEAVVSMIREALGRFPATPLAPEESPRNLMTGWLIDGKLPEGMVLGEECDLFDPAEGGSKWSGRRTDLESDEVREHLHAGMQVARLGLVYRDRLSFTLGEDLVIRKVRMLDVVLDELGETAAESNIAALAATFALMAREYAALLADLAKVFKIARPEDRA